MPGKRQFRSYYEDVFLKSRLFKIPQKYDWFRASLTIDTENKSLIFAPNSSSASAYYEEDCHDRGGNDCEIIEPSQMNLLQFKPPKSLKNIRMFEMEKLSVLELPGKLMLLGRSLKIGSASAGLRNDLCYSLQVALQPKDDNQSSTNSVHDSSAKQRNSKSNGGKVQSTVSDDAFVVVPSDVYDHFDRDTFPVTLVNIKWTSDIPVQHKLTIGSRMYLFFEMYSLQLLDLEKKPVYPLLFTFIRQSGYTQSMFFIELGARSELSGAKLIFESESVHEISTKINAKLKSSSSDSSDQSKCDFYQTVQPTKPKQSHLHTRPSLPPQLEQEACTDSSDCGSVTEMEDEPQTFELPLSSNSYRRMLYEIIENCDAAAPK